MLKRKTAASRFTRAVQTIAQWCRGHRHSPIAEQHQTLSQKIRGHYAYYGITGNALALQPISERGHLDLEALAVASSSTWRSDDLGPSPSHPEADPASACDRGPLGMPSRSVHVT